MRRLSGRADQRQKANDIQRNYVEGDNPVTIKSIEEEIADRAIANGWVKPERYADKTGKSIWCRRL